MADRTESLSTTRTPLGSLEKLPCEIRLLLFSKCFENRSISLLYANKQLYEEFIPSLRQNFVLVFNIDPTEPQSRVDIFRGQKHTLDLTSPHSIHYKIIDDMPLDQFKRIEILINAPDPADPGQLVRAWKQITGLMIALLPRRREILVGMLEHDTVFQRTSRTAALPPMIVKFREENGKRWTSLHAGQRVWNHGVPKFAQWDPITKTAAPIKLKEGNSDLEIIMIALLRIPWDASLTLQLPGGVGDRPKARGIDAILKLTTLIPQSRNPCDRCQKSHKYRDDEWVPQLESCIHFWLDYLLDDMEGASAAMLRLERFYTWCPKYDHLQSLRLWEAEILIRRRLRSHMAAQYADRFMAARVFAWRWDSRLPTTWLRRYPKGIPRKSENGGWIQGWRGHLTGMELTIPSDAYRITCSQLYGNHCFTSCRVCNTDMETIQEIRRKKKLDRRDLNKYLHRNYDRLSPWILDQPGLTGLPGLG